MTSPQDQRSWQRPDESGARPASARLVDPEDDVPSTGYGPSQGPSHGASHDVPHYGGDVETTAIPRYDTNPKPSGQSPFSLLGDPDPLPYVQPGAGLAPGAYGSSDTSGAGSALPTEVGIDDDRRADRRGTQDLGLLLVRVAVGVLLIAHGLQKLFGLWGGSGLGGFRDYLGDVGFRYADILSYVAAGGEVAAGVLLVLGLFTPIAAAGALAYLVNAVLAEAIEAHNEARLSAFLTDGHEYEVLLAVVVAAIVLIGPGRYAFDGGRGWARRPFVGSFAALVIGVGAGVAVWVLLNGTNALA